MSGHWYPRCHAILSCVFDRMVDDGTVDSFGSRARPLVVQAEPRSATVSLNDYYAADEWSVEFDAKRLPFSPEIIRNLAVEIYMYAAETLTAPFVARPDLVQILGIADRMKMRLDDETRSFEARGTDYTALLGEAPFSKTLAKRSGKNKGVAATGKVTAKNAAKKLARNQLRPGGQPLDRVVAQLVDEVLNVRGVLEVVWESDSPPPIIDRAPFTVAEGRSYWDVIYQLVLESGFICYVRGQQLVLTTAGHQRAVSERTQADVSAAVRSAQGGGLVAALGAGLTSIATGGTRMVSTQPTRILAWGRNLSYLEIEREVGRAQVPQQVVLSYDKRSGQVLEGRYPESRDVVVTGIGTEKNTQQVSVVPGITSTDVLKRYAREKYDAQARGEVVIRFATDDAEDLAGQSLINGMRPGCAVRLGLDALWDDSTAMRSMTAEQRYRALRQLDYSDRIARVVAGSYEALRQVDKPVYLTSANLAFGDGKIAIDSCEAMNFVSPAREAA